MVPECCFTLPNGCKCRCAATRNQPFCRHHMPHSAGPSISRRDRYSRIARWSQLSRGLAWLDPEEIPMEIYSILLSLLEDGPRGISDREAGRLLRGLLRRLGSVPFALPDPEPSPASAPAGPNTRAGHDLDSRLLSALLALGQAQAGEQ